MEIDNHILSLSMEFERQNIIINEYETNKAKQAHDRIHNKRRKTATKRITEPNVEEEDQSTTAKEEDEDAYEGNKLKMTFINWMH